jgi:hypothetical protein
MAVVHMGGGAEEALLAQLALEAARRQIGMGLARELAGALRQGNPAAAHPTLLFDSFGFVLQHPA